MHIKKVDIFGFKSFGFKNTTVQFEPGLVSISGPNGSGKSNILDAIIFAMGENKPKTMRVDKLRSLLHDIEGTRRGPKMARVNLQFDNSDRKIPVDSDTVEVTREMDDKGENNYYLNKKKTTRGHILDLLDVANAGINQLNAVQQGTVTRISEFSPEEKRQSIENLIGLSYFDEKKAESVKQLDEADRRLEIALAKMGEIKKRIDELEEERNQKLRYDMIERELNRYNAISAANKLKFIKSDKETKEKNLEEITNQTSKSNEERTTLRSEVQELDSQKLKFMEEVNAYNQAKATIDSDISNAMRLYEESSSSILSAKKSIQRIESRIPEIETEINQIYETKSELKSKIEKVKESLNNSEQKKKQFNAELELLDAERNKVLKEQSDAASRKLEVDKKIGSLRDKLNEVKLLYSKTKSEKLDSHNKIKSNTAKYNDYIQELAKLEKLKQKLDSIIKNHESTIAELKTRISGFNQKKSKQEKDLEELDLILEKSDKAAAQYATKIKTVKEIMHEDYSIAKLKERSEKLGINGLVYEMISWDKEYDRAALAAGSDWIKAVVVKDFETLIGIAELARSKNLPRFRIIPLDAIPKFKLEVPNEKGVIGVLSDFVKCDAKYSALKTFLFGNVILTNSTDSARIISKKGYKAVSINGEFFEAKGGGVIVDINSKISKLTKIISMSTSVDGLVQSVTLLKKYMQKKKTSLIKTESAIQSHKDRLSISEKELATVNHSYSDLKWKISTAFKMKEQLSSRISELQANNERLSTELIRHESHIESLNERIRLMHENYSDGEYERIANDLSRLNERKGSLEQKYSEIMSEQREINSKLSDLYSDDSRQSSNIKNLNSEKESLAFDKQELQKKIQELESKKESHNQELVKLREKEQNLIETSGTSVSKLKDFDDKLRELNEKDRVLTKEINSLERQSDSLNRDLKDLTERENHLKGLLHTYGYNENMETFNVDELIQGLQAELKSLNALNAKAPENYVEVSSGYRSMSTRKNSLEEERNSIVRFIEEIEKDKRQTFLDAFDKVDKEIRNAFGKMTGGNAWLELQNEDDIFNSGISYLIQFPNKPKRESTSISGGEKTLAAIVFVLALQKLKPSPFYLFDEVDAHLDAPNSERLSKILEERSKESQFVMVSLKDSVVQKAKLIYGVYPKNGVSYVVTYKDKRLPSMTT